MGDFNKIFNTNPQQPSRDTPPPNNADADKFKEYFKIDESDEQQKKRKKQAEEEAADTKAQISSKSLTSSPSTPTYSKKISSNPAKKVHKSHRKHPPQTDRPTEVDQKQLQNTEAVSKSLESEKTTPSEKTPLKVETSSNADLWKQNEIVREEISEITEKHEEEKSSLNSSSAIKHQKKHDAAFSAVPLPPPATQNPSFLTTPTANPPAYASLSSQVLLLFEQMVGVMQVLEVSGIKETTIHLNTPHFSSSIFSGAQIIIKEFNTAPLAYNIEFIGNPQAVALFQKNRSSLISAFQNEKYRFKVNRIDTSLQGDPETDPLKE